MTVRVRRWHTKERNRLFEVFDRVRAKHETPKWEEVMLEFPNRTISACQYQVSHRYTARVHHPKGKS